MKTLNETKNENFKLLCDCVGNQCLKIKKNGEWQNVNFVLSADDAVNIYPTGALLTSKINHNIHIMFVDNNGEILLEALEYDLNEMEAVISDINATVYNSGVLEDMCFYGGTHHFYYHTYLGSYFHETDYSRLVEKVKKYEQALKENYLNLAKPQNAKYTNFLFNCLNENTTKADNNFDL